jgi:hypothetical protein
MMRTTTLSALAISLAFLLVAGCSTPGPGEHDNRLEALYGSADAYDLVAGNRASGSVTAYKIDGRQGATGDRGSGEIAGYGIVGEVVDVSDDAAAALAAVLGDDATYDWDHQKGCKFQPGVAFRWEKRRTTVDVLLCFSCDELEIFLDGEAVGYEDFDAGRARLVRIVKDLFPHDAEAKTLEE